MALRLRLPAKRNSSQRDWRWLAEAAAQLPFNGEPIAVEFAPTLTAYRGKLQVSSHMGTPVYAATFLRNRNIILEQQLLADRDMLLFFLAHELFHFVWLRLGNSKRAQFSELISSEAKRRGCAGESSEVAKERWLRFPKSIRLWKNYVCESFCDSGAYLISAKVHTIGFRKRQRWFEETQPVEGWHC